MISEETKRKIEAAKTCALIIQDAGIGGGDLYIKDLPENEVAELAKSNDCILYKPTESIKHYWCGISIGKLKIFVSAVNVKSELVKELKEKSTAETVLS